jgi:acetyl esterase/lipase
MRRLCTILFLVPVLICIPAADAMSAVVVRRGVVYGTGRVESPSPQTVALRLDLWSPSTTATTPRPFAIFIHGGGFQDGSRDSFKVMPYAQGLANRGIVTAAIDYRLAGQKPVLSDRVKPLMAGMPPNAPNDFSLGAVAAIDDTLKAIDFLRANGSKIGIDATRLGLVGDSAGAMTADNVAYVLDDYGIERPPSVRFVASMWGGIIIAPRGGGNPASQLDAGEAPLFAAHGSADQVVPVAFSDDLVSRARGQAVQYEYHRLQGAKHDPPEFFDEPVTGDQTSFDRMLNFAVAKSRP